MTEIHYQFAGSDLIAVTTASEVSVKAATEAFMGRMSHGEMPPYTELNMVVLRALVQHAGLISDDAVAEILTFYEREKKTKETYQSTLDAAWKLLGWRPDAELDRLLEGAQLTSLHQFLGVLIQQPSLPRKATYLDRALHAMYNHPLFEQLYDEPALGAVRAQIEFRLLGIK